MLLNYWKEGVEAILGLIGLGLLGLTWDKNPMLSSSLDPLHFSCISCFVQNMHV